MKRTLRLFAVRTALALALILVLMAGFIVTRTTMVAANATASLEYPVPALDISAATSHLSTALRFETISYDDCIEHAGLRKFSRVAHRHLSALSRDHAAHAGGRGHAHL